MALSTRSTVLVAALVSSLMPAQASEPAARLLRLPTNATAAAVNPATGDVALVNLRQSQLWLLKSAWFDGDAAALVGPVSGVENPSWVSFKRCQDRTLVVVGCFAPGPVRVFDAGTLQALQISHNARADAVWMSVSRDPADPLVYISARMNNVPAVHVVNLAAKQLQSHPLLTFGRSAAKLAGAVVSSSGRRLYQFGDENQRLTVWRVRPAESPDKPPQLQRLLAQPDNGATRTQPPLALPYDLGLADGDSLLAPDAGPARSVLPAPVSCLLDAGPLGFGLGDQQLNVVSLAEPGVLASCRLAAELFQYQPHERELVARPAGSEQRFVIRPVVLADPDRERILVLGNRDVQVWPYHALVRSADVWLGLEVDVPRAIPAGKPWSTTVRRADPAATLVLQSAPDGMTLRGDVLSWTPPPGSLGPAAFTLHVARDGKSVQYELTVEVEFVSERTGLACSFPVSQVAVSPDGQRLVAWGTQATRASLAVIDAAGPRVLAERAVPGKVIDLRIAPQAVCVIQASGDQQRLLALDPQTLQTRGEAAVKVSEYRQRMGNLLQLRGRNQIVLDKCYSLPDLKEVTPPGPRLTPANDPAPRPEGAAWLEGRVAGGWCQEGAIWNEDLSQPRALLGPAGFLQAGPAISAWDDTWPRRPVRRAGGFSPAELAAAQAAEDAHAVTLGDPPAVLALTLRKPDPAGQPDSVAVELLARSRLDRRELRRWPLGSVQVEPGRSCSYCVAADGASVAVVISGRVQTFDLSEFQAANCARPLAFVPEQGPVLAAAAGPTRLTYRAVGGQTPYTLKAALPGAGDLNLVRPAPAGTLELEIDVAGYLAEQSQPLARALVDQSPATEAAEAIVARYREARTPVFRRLTGGDPTGVPVAMPIEVRVLDSGSQSARFCHYLLIDIPAETLAPPLDAEIAGRWKGTTVAAAAERRMHSRRWREFGDTLRNEHAAAAALGASLPPQPLAGGKPAPLDVAARQALAAIAARWQQTLFKDRVARCRNAFRTWTSADGRTARARLLRASGDRVVLITQSQQPFEIPLARLSPADQQVVRDTALTAEAAAREAAGDAESQLRHIGEAIFAFKARHTHLPPQSLAAPDGTPGLSWRVLLLPDLDAPELYALFRLDEPWDSVHNRQLVACLPPVYRLPGSDLEPGQTAVVGLCGPRTVFPPGRLVGDADCGRPPAEIALAVVAARDQAVAWTQPVDLPVDGEADFARQLDWHDDATLVLLYNGTVRRIQRSLLPHEWLRMADRGEASR